MSYTHHWERKPELDPTRFAAFVSDVKSLYIDLLLHPRLGVFSQTTVVIRGGNGTSDPIFNNEEIWLNGDCSVQMAYEGFYLVRLLENGPWIKPDKNGCVYEFCKTGRMPYDLLVSGALMALKHHFPEMHVWSDGRKSDFAETVEWYTKVLNRVPPQDPSLSWNKER